MTLTKDALDWAIEFVYNHSDGDLFPKILEIIAIFENRDDFIAQIQGKSLIVPKDEISYRQATQLYPQDSIILSAIIYQFGKGIEDRRLPSSQIFSYRFLPTKHEGLYSTKNAWNNFWNAARTESHKASVVLYCDIADFYNQIYHHTVENKIRRPKNSYPRRKRAGYYGIFSLRERPPCKSTSQQAAGY